MTTDPTDLIAECNRLLSAATPGPWYEHGGFGIVDSVDPTKVTAGHPLGGFNKAADAVLAAAAPSLIRQLCDALAAKGEEVDGLASQLALWVDVVSEREEDGRCRWCGCHWNSNGGHYAFCEYVALMTP